MKYLIALLFFLIYISPSEALERIIPNGKPSQLESEIKSIPGFPQKGIQVYLINDGNDVLLHIDESTSPLTVFQISKVESVINAHVPDWTMEQKEQEYESEIKTNDLCSAEFSELNVRINTIQDSINTSIDSITNLTDVKNVLTNMNMKYTAAFKKIVRCIRARGK